VADVFQKLDASDEIEGLEPIELVAEGDRVFVTGWSHRRVRSTGRKFDNRWVMAFSVRDGKITKFQEYAGTPALAAAHEHRNQVETSINGL
jgi:ketosteroid isomerase-like protein